MKAVLGGIMAAVVLAAVMILGCGYWPRPKPPQVAPISTISPATANSLVIRPQVFRGRNQDSVHPVKTGTVVMKGRI
jgi:hypothetical protein